MCDYTHLRKIFLRKHLKQYTLLLFERVTTYKSVYLFLPDQEIFQPTIGACQGSLSAARQLFYSLKITQEFCCIFC